MELEGREQNEVASSHGIWYVEEAARREKNVGVGLSPNFYYGGGKEGTGKEALGMDRSGDDVCRCKFSYAI